MSFRERVEAARTRHAEEARATADAEARERARRTAAVIDAANKLLREVEDALLFLRADQERSKAVLVARRGGLGRSPGVGLGGFGEVVEERSRVLRRVVDTRIEFAGWWVRDHVFDFEVPLFGDVTIGPAPRIALAEWRGTRWGLSEFVQGAIYHYREPVGEQRLSETHERTADEAIRKFVDEIEKHLVRLGPSRA